MIKSSISYSKKKNFNIIKCECDNDISSATTTLTDVKHSVLLNTLSFILSLDMNQYRYTIQVPAYSGASASYEYEKGSDVE